MVGHVTFSRPSFSGDEPREAMLAAVGSTDWPVPPGYGHPQQSPPQNAVADRALPRAGTAVYEWASLGVLLGGSALLFLWNLGASGWANAYAAARAVAGASTRWLVLAGSLIGFAFLAKMLQGFLVIPAFASVYLIAAPTTLWRRIWQVGAAALAVVVSAGWWIALVMLWPVDARPFIGGSQTNNIWDLILGYNGFGRLTGDGVGRVGGGPGPFSEGAGWLRLFQGELGSEVGWLLPAALIAMLVLLWATRRSPR